MARHNEILTGRHNRFLQKLFGMKGPPPAPQLTSEITPVHPLFHGAENRWLESWNRFAGSVQQANVAAQNTAIMFRNPRGSGVIAVVEMISMYKPIADQILISQDTGPAALATAFGVRCIDNRPVKAASNTLGANCGISGGNNFILTGGVIRRVQLQANTDYPFMIDQENQEITVLPADVLEFVTAGVNDFLTVSFVWRERALEDSEQQ